MNQQKTQKYVCFGVKSSFHQSLLSLCGKEIQLTLFTHEDIHIYVSSNIYEAWT